MALQTMYPAKRGSPQTTLAANLAADATSMVLYDASVLPDAPNIAVIGSDENCEIVSYTAINSSTNTVSGLIRGLGGSTPTAWQTGTGVARNFSSYDHDTFKDNIEELNSVKVGEAPTDGKPYLRYNGAWAKATNSFMTAGSIRTIVCDIFSSETSYNVGDYVIYGTNDSAKLYRFTTAHTGAWNASHVVQVQTMTEVQAKANTTDLGALAYKDDATSDSKPYVRVNGGWALGYNSFYPQATIRTIVCAVFSSLTSYNVGDYVIYGSNDAAKLYRFTTAHTGAWNASHVTQVQAMTDVEKKVLYFFEQSTSVTSTASSEFCSVSDSRIDADTVVLNCEFTVPSAITSPVSWTSTNGSISLKGICTSSNCKVNLVLGQKGN